MLSNEWTGDSATAFRSKGEALGKELLETAKLMENTARAIRKTAKNIYDAERAAIDIIEARKQLGGGFRRRQRRRLLVTRRPGISFTKCREA